MVAKKHRDITDGNADVSRKTRNAHLSLSMHACAPALSFEAAIARNVSSEIS